MKKTNVKIITGTALLLLAAGTLIQAACYIQGALLCPESFNDGGEYCILTQPGETYPSVDTASSGKSAFGPSGKDYCPFFCPDTARNITRIQGSIPEGTSCGPT
jgi:hypothetical protein